MTIVVQKPNRGCTVTFQAPDSDMFIMSRKELSELFSDVVYNSGKLFDMMPAFKQVVISTEVEKVT